MQSLWRFLCWLVLLLFLSINRPSWAAEGSPWSTQPSTELLQLLEGVNQQYGPDAVALLGLLLHAANQSGSVLTASVRINGTETRQNATFLTFQVETGLIFNTETMDQATRLFTLWSKILAEAFSHLKSLQVPADGVMVSLQYYHRPYGGISEVYELTDQPGVSEEARFYFGGEPLRAFLQKEVSAKELLARSFILLDNTPTALQLPEAGEKGTKASRLPG